MTIPRVQIVSARDQTPAEDQNGGRDLPPFCRVVALAAPTEESRITFEVWLPAAEHWNGKLLGTGNGGFSGAVPHAAMAAGLARGYATVGTDTGHSGDQMQFGQGAPERIVDWAYRSVHIMTTSAKLLVRKHFGRLPAKSYFNGCSTGGQQALSQAQRFPEDYDGIVAGSPGHNRRQLILGFLWSWNALHPHGRPVVTADDLALITRAFVAACDKRDGLEDGLVADPRACGFDLSTLACRRAGEQGCLSSEQIDAVRTVYGGAHHRRTGRRIFPGWLPGSESGWPAYLLHPPEPMRLGLFKYFVFHDPDWDWRSFDWDRDLDHVQRAVPELDATSPDLQPFRERGGKLLMYAGWADPVVPATDTVDYHESVAAQLGGYEASRDFLRLFVAPGMGHCGGGAAPDRFDALAALESWVEHGVAPDRLIATQVSPDGEVVRTRPICAWPEVAVYAGGGDVNAADSYDCAGAESP